MDTEWFEARMELVGVSQEDIGRKLFLDRTTVSRIKNGHRPITLAEVEPLAGILQVEPIEIIERAYAWKTPIRIQTELHSNLLVIALSVADRVLAGEAYTSAQDHASLTQAIYEQLIASEAQGQPIDTDERALRLIEDTLRRARAAGRRRSQPG